MVTAATIGSKLENARKRLNWKLSDVSEKTGLAQSALSDFENGKRSPKVAQLKQLADVYRRDIGFFLSEETLPNETVLWRQEPTGEHASEVKSRLISLAESFHNLEIINGETPLWSSISTRGRRLRSAIEVQRHSQARLGPF